MRKYDEDLDKEFMKSFINQCAALRLSQGCFYIICNIWNYPNWPQISEIVIESVL